MKGKKTEAIEVRFPDFWMVSNNNVTAVYSIAPEILQRESSRLAGVPFLFYVGTSPVDEVNERAQQMAREAIKGGSVPHYFSGSDLTTMLEGTIKSKDVRLYGIIDRDLPKQIEIVPGTFMPLNQLVPRGVPYSFGIGHERDVRDHTQFRTLSDYRRMTQEILPDVRAERAYTEEQHKRQAAAAALFLNRLRALVGSYHPRIESYAPQVRIHPSWCE